MNSIHIHTYPRIHFSLIGMSNEGYRINGGAGCSISAPLLDCHFVLSNSLQIIDQREYPMSAKELNKLTQTIESCIKKYELQNIYKCVINSDTLFPHTGFGSNTMIYLSCIEALFILNGLEYTQDDIVINSTRGGTSGVGIHTYFNGGVSIDLGVDNIKEELRPSSLGARSNYPLQLCGFQAPQWTIGIMIPIYVPSITEQQEIDFFRQNTPIPLEDVKSILYEIIFGIAGSLKDTNFQAFCDAVNNLQQTKWKALERGVYGKELQKIERYIKETGAMAVGMSSLGPMLYFLGKDIPCIIDQLKKVYVNSIFIEAKFNNNAREIVYGE